MITFSSLRRSKTLGGPAATRRPECRWWRAGGLTLILFTTCVLPLWAQSRPTDLPRPAGSGREQRSRRYSLATDIAFSPDGQLLAIARGSSDYHRERFGEVQLWDIRTEKLIRTLRGFTGPVRAIAFSPDGTTLISGSGGVEDRKPTALAQDARLSGEVIFWDARTGEVKLRMNGLGEEVTAVAYSPDGRLVVCGARSFWPEVEGDVLADLARRSDPTALPRSPTSAPRSSGRPRGIYAGEIHIWNVSQAKWQRPIKGYNGSVTALAFSPDSQWFAVGRQRLNSRSGETDVKIYETRNLKEKWTLKDQPGDVNALMVSPDSRLLAVASGGFDLRKRRRYGALRVWALSAQKLEWEAPEFPGAVTAVAFAPDGKTLASSADSQGGVQLWDVQTGQHRQDLGGRRAGSTSSALSWARPSGFILGSRQAVFSPDGQLLATSNGGGALLWDLSTGSIKAAFIHNVAGPEGLAIGRQLVSINRVVALVFSPDGRRLASGGEDKLLKLWDPRAGAEKWRLADSLGELHSLAFAPDGKLLAVSDESAEPIKLIDAETGQVLQSLYSAGGLIHSLAFSSDGQLLAGGSDDRTISLWNAVTGRVQQTLAGHDDAVLAVAFAPDNKRLVSAGADRAIRLWDVATGALLQAWVGHSAAITSLAWAPDGQTFASSSADKTLKLWEVPNGRLKQTLTEHDEAVNSVVFSADGRFLASGSDDRTVKIWEAETGKVKRTLKGHELTVAAVAFSPDGQLLASGSGNNAIVIWNVQTGDLERVLRESIRMPVRSR